MRPIQTALLVALLSFPLQPCGAADGPRIPSRVKSAAVHWMQTIGWDKKIGCAVSLLAAATTFSYTSTFLHAVTTLPDPTITGFGVVGATSGFLISWKALRRLIVGQNPLAHSERVEGAGILAGSFVGSWLAYGLVDAGAWAPIIGGLAGLGAGWKAAPPLDRRLQSYLRDTPPLDACLSRIFPAPAEATVLSPEASEIPEAFALATRKLAGQQTPYWVVRSPGSSTEQANYHLLIAEKVHGVRLILVFSDSLQPGVVEENREEAVIWRPLADLAQI